MSILVCSRSSAFKRHIESIVDSDVYFQGSLGAPETYDGRRVSLVHLSSFGEDEVSAYIERCAGSHTIVALADDLPDTRKLLLFTEKGILGYCNSYMAAQHYLQMFRMLRDGASWYPPAMLKDVFRIAQRSSEPEDADLDRLQLLTDREREIVTCVANGKSNKEVAMLCNITERTVKAHLTSIYEKLHVKDRVSLLIHLNQRPVA